MDRNKVPAFTTAGQREVVGNTGHWQGESDVGFCLTFSHTGNPNHSFRRRVAKMSFVHGVGGSIVQHAVNGGGQWLELYHARKYRAIANFGVDDKGRPLADLKRVKFRSG